MIDYHIRKPWAQKLFSANNRCNNKNNAYYYMYGGKGIKCFLNLKDVERLWIRDNAHKMERPSLDRKDSSKDYTFSNCRFIEYRLNALQGSINSGLVTSKKINKLDLKEKFIRKYSSIGNAAIDIGNYDYKYNISKCLRGLRISAYGYIWRYVL